MEVLEHGKLYERKNHVIKCDCGCKFKYSTEDIKSEPRLFLNHNMKWLYCLVKYVECPECGEKYWFDERTPITKEEYDEMVKGLGLNDWK